MAQTDDEVREQQDISTPIESKDDYLAAQDWQRPGFVATQDATEVNIGQTVNTKGGVTRVSNDVPGQMFAPWQLPNPEAAKQAGLPVAQIPEHLILGTDEEETHPQGPDTLDRLTREIRQGLGNPMLHTVGAEDDRPRDKTGSKRSVARSSRDSQARSEQGDSKKTAAGAH